MIFHHAARSAGENVGQSLWAMSWLLSTDGSWRSAVVKASSETHIQQGPALLWLLPNSTATLNPLQTAAFVEIWGRQHLRTIAGTAVIIKNVLFSGFFFAAFFFFLFYSAQILSYEFLRQNADLGIKRDSHVANCVCKKLRCTWCLLKLQIRPQYAAKNLIPPLEVKL